jgi:hydrogenase-4 component E
VLPAVLRRALAAAGPERRVTRPLVNVAASLLAAAALTLLAFAVSRPLVDLAPSAATRAVPVGFAVLLIGFFVLVTRRRALSQVIGFLLMDNGITAVGFLTTSGIGLVVEVGVALDVLLVVLVLQVLTGRMRDVFGRTDLDELRELRD